MAFTVKDSGERARFETGAQRDLSAGKGRYELLSPHAIKRLAQLYETGALKYDARNWEKGISADRCLDSALRHLFQYLAGDRTEDHAAAVMFNISALIHYEETGREDLWSAMPWPFPKEATSGG